MNGAGAGLKGRLASGPGGGGRGGPQPASQGARGRQGRVGEMAAEDNADQVRPPLRMGLAQGVGLEDDLRGGPGPAGGHVVSRAQAFDTAQTSLAEQVVGSASGQAKLQGQSGDRTALLEGPPQGLADGHGNGAWHGRKSQGRGWVVQNLVTVLCAKGYGRQQARLSSLSGNSEQAGPPVTTGHAA